MVTVKYADPASYAGRRGIRSGDKLESINGHVINDVLDYRFYICEKQLRIRVIRDGEPVEITVKKPEYDDIGLEFDTFLMDNKHSCRNKCVFCFIDQLPGGMRDTLYFKDDDSRLSFLQGNYITMTNLSDADVDRIITMKMSPVNISVHTMNPDLRVKMLNNRFAGECLKYLRRFYDAKITMNCQIVLCKGINDGDELDYTMKELRELSPYVHSVSVVPAGMTKFREGLFKLEEFSPEETAKVIRQVEAYASVCAAQTGENIFCCADEMYLKAGIPIPDGEYYGGYPQIENGVGMMASMLAEFNDGIEDCEVSDTRERTYSAATGTAAYPFITSLCKRITEKFPFIKINTYEIKNDFFGHGVTVSGLLTGKDIINQLSGKELGERLFMTKNALKSGEDLFLCGTTVNELENALGVKAEFCPDDGYEFIGMLTQ